VVGGFEVEPCADGVTCTDYGVWEDRRGQRPAPAYVRQGATANWLPAPVGGDGVLDSVSCAAGSCVAVGHVPAPGRGSPGPFARHFDGQRWSAMPAPPRRLDEISCVSERWCLATGTPPLGSNERTAAAVWDGTAWTAHDPKPGYESINGLSCLSETWCVGVGQSGQANTVSRWDGVVDGLRSGWSLEILPAGPGGRAELSDVDCAATDDCVAVGSRRVVGGRVPAAWVRAANGWVLSDPPVPPGATTATLSSVSCYQRSPCIAVGTIDELGPDPRPLRPRWTGTEWVNDSPFGGDAAVDSLRTVDCRDGCTTAGVHIGGGGIDRYAGIATTPSPRGPIPSSLADRAVPARLSTVACSGRTFCLVGGEHVHRWDGGTWRPLPASDPTSAPGVRVGALSCTAATSCTALAGTTTTEQPVSDSDLPRFWTRLDRVLRWDGSAFAALPAPPIGEDRELTAVSCTGDSCLVLGVARAGRERPVFALWWDGATWREQSSPPDLAGQVGVSCWAAQRCMVVGAGFTDIPFGPGSLRRYHASAATWDGRGWTARPLPPVTGNDVNGTELADVSCLSATFCAGAGRAFFDPDDTPGLTADPLLATWDGEAWRQVRQTRPAGTMQAGLRGVSCATATMCLAVGRSVAGDDATNPQPVSSVWDGRTWQPGPALAAPTPTGLTLADVACSGPTCQVVGDRTIVRYRPGPGA
jgi:hypothetical protein